MATCAAVSLTGVTQPVCVDSELRYQPHSVKALQCAKNHPLTLAEFVERITLYDRRTRFSNSQFFYHCPH